MSQRNQICSYKVKDVDYTSPNNLRFQKKSARALNIILGEGFSAKKLQKVTEGAIEKWSKEIEEGRKDTLVYITGGTEEQRQAVYHNLHDILANAVNEKLKPELTRVEKIKEGLLFAGETAAYSAPAIAAGSLVPIPGISTAVSVATLVGYGIYRTVKNKIHNRKSRLADDKKSLAPYAALGVVSGIEIPNSLEGYIKTTAALSNITLYEATITKETADITADQATMEANKEAYAAFINEDPYPGSHRYDELYPGYKAYFDAVKEVTQSTKAISDTNKLIVANNKVLWGSEQEGVLFGRLFWEGSVWQAGMGLLALGLEIYAGYSIGKAAVKYIKHRKAQNALNTVANYIKSVPQVAEQPVYEGIEGPVLIPQGIYTPVKLATAVQ